MSQIASLLERILHKQKEMGYLHFSNDLRPPVSLNEIKNAEKQLNLIFNQDLIDLYSFADGEEIQSDREKGKSGLIPIHNLLTLNMAVNCYELPLPGTLFTTWDTNYTPGPKVFPFITDGAGNYYWVDLNVGQNYGRIYWTNTYPSSPGYEYESLTSMFAAILEGYEKGFFFMDAEGYLDCDFEGFEELSEKYKPMF